MAALLEEVEWSHTYCSINTLCSSQEQRVQFMCFKAAQPLQEMLPAYYRFANHYPSELFQQIWESRLKTVASKKQVLTFADVVTKIWKPVFNECCQLIDGVKGLTITLADVNRHFHPLRGDGQAHLELLFKATEACHKSEVGSTTWIRGALDRMQHYWSVCEQAEVARTVLQLKESLQLQGNFEAIERIAGTESMDKRTLSDIDEELIEVGSFLENFTKDRSKRKLECLKSFAACLDIVEWIRNESKGIFVSILAVARKLYNLSFFQMSMICTSLSPLLYTLLWKRETSPVIDFPILKLLEVVLGLLFMG
jgi:hypothetical protein